MMHKMIKNCCVFTIKIYKYALSPFLPCGCRYAPSCSEYMIEAIEKHGTIRGLKLGTKRLCRCHPWGGHGYDPVPHQQDHTTPQCTNNQIQQQSKQS